MIAGADELRTSITVNKYGEIWRNCSGLLGTCDQLKLSFRMTFDGLIALFVIRSGAINSRPAGLVSGWRCCVIALSLVWRYLEGVVEVSNKLLGSRSGPCCARKALTD